MLQLKTRSKDLKIQKIQGCVLKAIGSITKVSNALLELKNSKNLNTTTRDKNLNAMVHDCTDSLALLSQVNIDLEQNKRDHIAYCIDNQYHALRKNGPADSEFLSGDNLPKRIMNVTTNKGLFSTSKTSFQSHNPSLKSSKNLRRFPQNPGNRNQNGYQSITRNNTAIIQQQYSSNNSNKYHKQKKH